MPFQPWEHQTNWWMHSHYVYRTLQTFCINGNNLVCIVFSILINDNDETHTVYVFDDFFSGYKMIGP